MNSPLDFQIIARLAIFSHTLESVSTFPGSHHPTDLPVANVTWRDKEAMASGRVVAVEGMLLKWLYTKMHRSLSSCTRKPYQEAECHEKTLM